MGTQDEQVQRLGDVAVRRKFITPEQLDAALERQRELGVPIGEVLVEMGFVTPSQVAAILKFQRAVGDRIERATKTGHRDERDPLLGEVLGGCLILEKLGAGAMGTAYKAHHLKLDRDVCIKVLHPDLVKDRRTQARFTREARASAKLEHVGIVSVYDFDEVPPYTFIVMQYVDGKSLKDVLDSRGPIGPKRATFVAARIAEALACAHEQKIVHRDVKPANVLISRAGQIKLTDFGLVRVIDPGASKDGAMSSFGELIGTPTYMSPEQAQALPEIDGRSDVYSLGVLMYELASGKLPFEARQLVSLLRRHMLEPFPSLQKLCPECPPELDELLQRFCAKDPNERPDAAGAARELRSLYRTAFGAEPPADVTGPSSTGGFGAPLKTPPGGIGKTKALSELPTAFYSQKDILDAAVDKLVARAVQGQLAQSVKDARRLQPLVAREATVRMLKGVAAAGQHREITGARDVLLEVAPNVPEVYPALARAYQGLGKLEDAELMLTQAVSLAPSDVDLAIELAQLRGSLGKKREALAALQSIVLKFPQDAMVHRRAAEVRYIVLGDFEGAAAWFGVAADLDRSSFEARQQQGFLLLECKRYPEACRALEDAIARSPSSSLAHELLGRARLAKGDKVGATFALRRALDLDPLSGARALLIEDAKSNKRWNEVSRLATDGLVRFPDDRDLTLVLAGAREALGDVGAAMRMYANVLEKDAKNATAKAGLERITKQQA